MSSAADFSSLFDLLPIGAYRYEAASGRWLANRALAQLFGFAGVPQLVAALESLGPDGWYVQPGRRAEFRALLDAQGSVRDFVSEMRRPGSGQPLWVSENADVVRDAAGAVLHCEGTLVDITGHVAAQRELREKTRALQITLDCMSQAISAFDADGRILMFNRRYQELLDLPDALMAQRPTLGQLVRFQIERGDFGQGFSFVDAIARGYVSVGDKVPPLQGPEVYLRKTGDGRTLEVRTLPLPDGGAVRTFTDMTDYVRTQEALIAAKDAAEAGERAKAEFLANMSHEIRTPMNAVIGMSDLLLDTPLNPQQREFAETIRTSGDALLGLINDILDFSKIESGHLSLEQVPVPLAECVEAVLDLSGAPAAAKGLDLLYWIEDDVPAAITGDPTRLRQVLLNLVSNAVKFTAAGEVVVTVSRRRGAEGQPLLGVSVRDTGIGIPPAALSRLFEVFTQVDASTTRRFGGTGLGLAICRRLVTLMGGRIWVESREGEGSDFRFEIPLREALAPAPAPSRAPVDLRGRRLLVVDDNATNRRILALQARRWGLEPETASGAQEALQWVDAGRRYDAAVLDVQMPLQDGYQLAAELRRRPATARLPLLMLTSLGELAAPAGIEPVRMLSKPAKALALQEALAGLLERAPAPAVAAGAAGGAPKPGEQCPLRVLLAEDNLINQRVAALLLKGLGYELEVVDDGERTLAAVHAARAQGRPFDVVLMDVQMPVLDGLAATRRLCGELPRPADRPWIVAMTANAMEGDREDCLAAGMDAYLSKPIRAVAVEQALREAHAALGRRRNPAG